MEDSKEIDTPIATVTKFDLDELGSSVDQKIYRGMIGSLLYLIASKSKGVSLEGCQEDLEILKRHTDLCLWYLKGSNFYLVGYANTDYAGEEPVSTEQVTSGFKTSDVSEIAKNFENRFVLVGSIIGVETDESGKIGGKTKKGKEKESEDIKV
ncbi:uncharacterized protein [Nicotiana tomentosiformis]|uniref:uncharacterized protein n=1 Tax=Nicotiana tomentosiformis TaxID=4098 RepID=UPI00388CC280